MSVQAGVWNLNGAPVDQNVLARFSRYLAEFGTDGETAFVGGSVGLLYRPFHTTAESRSERQPYVSMGGKLVLWDGRLDNRDELLPDLSNDLSSDRTDVALVAAAFDRRGPDCLKKLVGDWALSVWDPVEKELVLARDYLGVRQLFYHPKADQILWCSHLAPLVLCGDGLTLCDEYIAGYLAFYPDAHLTPFREIRSVPPGSYVRLRGRKITMNAYWTFEARFKTRYKTDAEYEEHYRFLLRQSVRRRLRTDSPVLAELSGGLDSSSIVCMADEIISRESPELPRVDTLSFYDSNEPDEDDSAHFTKVESKRGRGGLNVDLRASGDSLPLEYSSFVPIPGFTRSEVDSALLDIFRRKEYRVVLSGLGGDELNGMALNPRVLLAELLRQFRLGEFSKQLVAWSLLIRKPGIQLFFAALSQFLPAVLRCKVADYATLEPWMNRSFARKHRISLRQLRAMDGVWFFRPGMRDSAEGLVSLANQTTHTCPSPVEHRYPYLDRTLVEFLTSIPLDQLSRPGQRRSLMRRALKNILPPEISARKTKVSASRCYAVSLEKHWGKIQENLASPLIDNLGYVNQGQMQKSLLEVRHGKVSKYFPRLFNAFSLELWLRDLETRHVLSIQPSAFTRGGKEFAPGEHVTARGG
ncbi:MAG TPA: asparagine synthase-related protein [Candidatus Angelobacter sp.]